MRYADPFDLESVEDVGSGGTSAAPAPPAPEEPMAAAGEEEPGALPAQADAVVEAAPDDAAPEPPLWSTADDQVLHLPPGTLERVAPRLPWLRRWWRRRGAWPHGTWRPGAWPHGSWQPGMRPHASWRPGVRPPASWQPGVRPIPPRARRQAIRTIGQLVRRARRIGARRTAAGRLPVFRSRAAGRNFRILARPRAGLRHEILSIEPELGELENKLVGPPTLPQVIAQLGQEWSERRNGNPPAAAISAWLLRDHEDTLAGARRRWRQGQYEGGAITRAWLISRREQMLFQTAASAGLASLRNFTPPAGQIKLVTTPLIKDSDKAPVAPLLVRFVSELRQRYRKPFDVWNYRGHGGGKFHGRGFSLDFSLPGRDKRGFYPPEDAATFLRAVHETARGLGAEWRALYNDFMVADTVNRETGARHVVFMGTVRRGANRGVRGLNWHGPHPLILHFHLDLAPARALPQRSTSPHRTMSRPALQGETSSPLEPGPDFESDFEFEAGAACAGYTTGELQKSRTQAGHLSSDLIEDRAGNPLIADFAVNSTDVKASVKNDPVLKSWLNTILNTVVREPNAKLRIVGYSDCVGAESGNLRLRQGRAQRVSAWLARLLEKDPRWKTFRPRITFVGAAPAGRYVADNSTVEGRARNRGVVLELQRTISFPEEPIAAGPCTPYVIERARKLLLSDRARQVIPTPTRERLLEVVTRLTRPQKDDRYLTRADVDVATKKVGAPINWNRVTVFFEQLCAEIAKTGRPSDDDLLHRLLLLDNLILNGICRLRHLAQSPPGHLDHPFGRAWLGTLSKTLSKLLADDRSVYRGYSKLAPTDCPKTGLPVPVPRRPTDTGGKPPSAPTIHIPRPTTIIVQFKDPAVPQWLKDAFSGVAKLTGISLSALMVAIPAPVLEKAVKAAWLVFQLRNLPVRALFGEAGEAAARAIAEWTVQKLGGRVLNLNTLEKNFIGLDLLTTAYPGSVKAFGVVSRLSGLALEKSLQSRYKGVILKIAGDGILEKRFQGKVAARLLKFRTKIGAQGVWPSALSGQVTEQQAVRFVREKTVFFFPDDHVQLVRRHMGRETFELYKAARKRGQSIFGLPAGLDDNTAAGKISDLWIERVQPLGVKSTDLRLLLDVAQRLPDARDAVVKRGVKKWPAAWGPPPTWTGSVLRP